MVERDSWSGWVIRMASVNARVICRFDHGCHSLEVNVIHSKRYTT